MPHTTVYNPEAHIIETKYQGTITIDEFKEITLEIAKIAQEHNCFFTLGDYREARVNLSTLEIYELPRLLSNTSAQAGTSINKFKRAFVIVKNLEDFHFFEDVAVNSGQTAKVCYSIEEAKEWLAKK